MKYRLILCGAVIASLLSVSAQKQSLYFDKIYEAGEEKPTQATPPWDEFSVNGEGAHISFGADGSLYGSINTNSAFCYTIPLQSVGDITTPYAVEYAVQASMAAQAGFDLDMRTPEGEQVSFRIQKQYLINRMDRDTLCRDMDNSLMSAFRFVFDDDSQTKIYKNGELLSSVPRIRTDVIADPGFEKSTKADPIWWWSSWSQVTIDGNSPHAGSKSLHWENGWTGQLGAQIPVQPHSKYRLTYWAKAVKVNAWQSAMKGSLWVGGVNRASLNIPAGNTYQKYTVEFTTGSNEERADIEFHNGWNDSDAGLFAVYIDDMELTRLEGDPYIQFGKLSTSGEGQFALRYVAVSAGESLTPVLFPDLTGLISQAETLHEEAVVGDEPGNFPQYAVDRLHTELAYAEERNESDTYFLVDEAFARLQREVNRFEKCKVTRADLEFEQFEFEGFTGKLRQLSRVRLVPSGIMSDGEVIDKELIYLTYASEEGKLSVSEEGMVTALEVGEDKLIVTAYYKNAVRLFEIPVEIERYAIQKIEVSAYEDKIRLGDATGTKVSVVMTDGEAPEEGLVPLRFESSAPDIVQVNSGGVLLAKSPGVATVKVSGSFMDQEESTEMTVTVVTIDRIELEVPEIMQSGSTEAYTVKAYYTDGTEMQPGEEDVVVYSDNRHAIQPDDWGRLFIREQGEATLTARIKQATALKKASVKTLVESAVALPQQQVDAEYIIRQDLSARTITIDLKQGHSFTVLSLFTVGGEVRFTENVVSDRMELDANLLAPGVYILVLQGGSSRITERLVIL